MRRDRWSNSISLLICVLVLVLVDIYLIPNDFGYMNVKPNPYLVLSVFFSSLYGLTMSFIAGLVCASAFLLSVHLNLNYDEVESLIDFTYLSIPIGLMALSVILGELSDRRLRWEQSLKKELSDLSKVEGMMKARAQEQEKEITELKKRLVSRLDTTRSFFETARSFHSLDEDDLLENLTQALKKLFKTTKVELLPMSGVRSAELCTLSQKAIRLKKQVTIADLLREKDGAGTVSLVLPIILDDEVEYLLELSEIPFLEYIPSNFRISEIYGQWISSSLSYGRNFRRSERQNIWNEELKVHKYHYFEDRIEEEFERAKSFMLPLSILKISLRKEPDWSPAKFLMIQKLFVGVASKEIRKLDYISEGKVEGEFLIVMPVSDESKATEIWIGIKEKFLKLDIASFDVKITEWSPEMENVEALIAEGGG